MKRPRIFLALAAAAIAALAFGCNDSTSPTSSTSFATSAVTTSAPTTISPNGSSKSNFAGEVLLRVAHFSTDAPPVDVWVNGSVVLSGVPFKTVSDYLTLDAGEYRIQVTPAGAKTPVVIDATVTLEPSHVYTVAAVGFLSSGTLQPLVLLDDRSVGTGARLRFVHASADTGPVDVALAGGAVLFPNVSFQRASEYIEVPGGTYDLEVRPAGGREVALSIPGVAVSDGTTYTVFAVGRSFNGTLGPLPVVDAP